MKKTLFGLIISGLLMAIAASSAYAQTSGNVIAFSDPANLKEAVRSIDQLLDQMALSVAVATEATSVHARALKDFNTRFAAATNAKWYETPGGFLSYFRNASSENRVIYDRKGRWQYTIKSYGEDQLPADVRASVKRAYYDYRISIVEEIDVPGGMNYFVHLEDGNTVKNLRVTEEGDMDLISDLIQSK